MSGERLQETEVVSVDSVLRAFANVAAYLLWKPMPEDEVEFEARQALDELLSPIFNELFETPGVPPSGLLHPALVQWEEKALKEIEEAPLPEVSPKTVNECMMRIQALREKRAGKDRRVMTVDIDYVRYVTDLQEKAESEFAELGRAAITVARQYAPIAKEMETLNGVKRDYDWELDIFSDFNNDFSLESVDPDGDCVVLCTTYCGGGEYHTTRLGFPVTYLWDGLDGIKAELENLCKAKETERKEKEIREEEQRRQRVEERDQAEYQRLKRKYEPKGKG